MVTMLRDRIRERRRELKLTQAEVARGVKVSRLTYIAIESGDKNPTLEQIETISSILGVTLQNLLFPKPIAVEDLRHQLAKYRQMCLACIKFGGSENDGKITKTKLAKLLYLVDFSWYASTKKSMSMLEYRALPRGPVADAFFQVTDDMFETGQILIEPKGPAQMFSLVEGYALPDISSDELSHIKLVCARWQDSDTQTIVEFTHNQSPWMLTQPGTLIDYDLVSQVPQEKLF